MPTVRIMVAPPARERAQGEPFHMHPKEFKFSRVPCMGEVVSLGKDKSLVAETYRVLMVMQIAGGPPATVDAELYVKSIEFEDLLREVEVELP